MRGGFDAHTHLDFSAFDADRDEVVARARAAGVTGWVIAGSEDWDRAERVARETGGVAVLGVHPWTAASALDLRPQLDDLARRPLVAVGEIGLDPLHAPDAAARDRQRVALRAQLAIARERDLPIVLHCVRAYPELAKLLERDGVPRVGGQVHAWSGPPDLVPRFLALGLHVSFAPIVLRDRARKARASVPLVPDDRLLVETDCPDMAPPGAGRGEPAHLVEVAAEVARLRGQSLDHVWTAASANARRLFQCR